MLTAEVGLTFQSFLAQLALQLNVCVHGILKWRLIGSHGTDTGSKRLGPAQCCKSLGQAHSLQSGNLHETQEGKQNLK